MNPTAAKPSLTPRTQDVLRFVRRFINDIGIAPTLEEIAAHLGISKVTVHEHVAKLARLGHLTHTPGCARSIKLTELVTVPRELVERTMELMNSMSGGESFMVLRRDWRAAAEETR